MLLESNSMKLLILSAIVIIGQACAQGRSASSSGQANEQQKSEARTQPEQQTFVVNQENDRVYQLPSQNTPALASHGVSLSLPGLSLNVPHTPTQYVSGYPETVYFDEATQQYVYANQPQPEVVVPRPPHIPHTPSVPHRPPTVIPVQGNCGFAGLKGKCATIPNWFSCIRNGGLLAPDVSRCQLLSACCVRVPFRMPALFGANSAQNEELVDFD